MQLTALRFSVAECPPRWKQIRICDIYQPVRARYLPDRLSSPVWSNAQQGAVQIAAQPATMPVESGLCLLQQAVLHGEGQTNEELLCPTENSPSPINAGFALLDRWPTRSLRPEEHQATMGNKCASETSFSEIHSFVNTISGRDP